MQQNTSNQTNRHEFRVRLSKYRTCRALLAVHNNFIILDGLFLSNVGGRSLKLTSDFHLVKKFKIGLYGFRV
jgi:hypothetical protein